MKFSKAVINLCRHYQKDVINRELISQLVGASTSVGANYREANDASSKRDFYHKISICRREAKESKYWLELLAHANKNHELAIEPLLDEALQLTRIFAAIVQNKSAE